MSAQHQYYPPSPAPPPPQQQQQHQFAPPPTSPPANKTQFYPPPPSQASPSQGTAYPPPPQLSPSPQLHQPTPVNYPPPPVSAPTHQRTPSQQASLAIRPTATPTSQGQNTPPPPPPQYPQDNSPYPPEKQTGHESAGSAPGAASGGASGPLTAAGLSGSFVSGAPPPDQFVGAMAVSDDVGTFNGGSYRISHRDCNTILTIQLAMGAPLSAKPGAMIAMSHSVTLKGQLKFSVKKMVAGADIGTTHLTGPGEILLGPPMLGDITSLRLTGKEQWMVGQDAYLASTQGIIKDHKRQNFSKAMFSGEGLFVYKIGGTGLLWLTSFGAIIRKDLVDGERYLVDNGHLIAWNCKYVMERVASGGIISGLASNEGLVCKFTGPGTVFIQTRNPKAFGAFMSGQQYKEFNMPIRDPSGRRHQPYPLSSSDPLASATEIPVRRTRSNYSSWNQSSDEYHATSKFVEAMRNPDWRRRRTDNESTESTCTEDSNHRQTGVERPKVDHGFMAESALVTRLDSSDNIANISKQNAKQQTYSGAASGREGKENLFSSVNNNGESRYSLEESGFCEVLRHVDFSGLQPVRNPLSIIEVVPVARGDSTSADHYGIMNKNTRNHQIVEIRPFKLIEKSMDKTSLSIHDEQIAAALRATETTPEKMRTTCRTTRYSNGESQPSRATDLDKARQAVLNDPAVAGIGTSPKHSGPKTISVGRQDGTSQLASTTAQQFKERDMAFRKMLQKLKKGVDREPNTILSAECHNESAGSSAMIQPPDGNVHHKYATEVPQGNLHIGESNDQAASLRNVTKSSTWNPRAREFLSLTDDQSLPTDEPKQPGRNRRTPLAALFSPREDGSRHSCNSTRSSASTGNKGSISDFSHSSMPDVVSLAVNGANMMPSPYVTLAESTMSPIMEPLYQQGTLLDATTLSLMGLSRGITLPHGGFNPSQLGLPFPCNSPIPHPIGPYEQIQGVAPWDGVPFSAAGPSAVPKPRKPDSRDQQAYEAWIEWRKANEPGYAMQCKLRQQRRAQRVRITKPTPDSKNGVGEVATFG
ncbi:hypothetical protein HJFPF1_02011 [Paramyrothecium foliicola]|nr:hypothetical protein HJFPF1_02011 [Paramyrothecium foliicola]